MDSMETLTSYIWSSSFWLPVGYDWSDFEDGNVHGILFPLPITLSYVVPVVGVMLCVSTIARSYLFPIMGTWLGISSTQIRPPRNDFLEACFIVNKGRHPRKPEHFERLSSITKLSSFQLKTWFQMRTLVSLYSSDLIKFTNSSLRCVDTMISFSLGLSVLWDKEWFSDIDQCLIGYPYHNVYIETEIYYIIAISIYIAKLISSHRVHDERTLGGSFSQMVILVFLVISWIANFTRIGILLLVIHDTSDLLLEISQVLYFAKKMNASASVRLVVGATWTFSYLYFLPFVFTKRLNVKAEEEIIQFPAFSTLIFLLDLLFCINAFRTLLWFKTAIEKRSNQNYSLESQCFDLNKTEGDQRPEDLNGSGSDSESCVSSSSSSSIKNSSK